MENPKEKYSVGEYYLTKNRAGIWCRTWYESETQQRRSNSLGTRDFQEAKKKLDAWFIKNSTPVLDSDLELSRCLLEHWNHHTQHLARADTERRNADLWLDYFDTALVRDIRPAKQRDFINWLIDKKYAKGTIESIFKTGAAAINYAWKNDMIPRPIPLLSPTKELTKYKLTTTERWRPMEAEEIAKLIDHSDRDRLVRFILILIGTGSRPEAAIELCGSQIDLEAGTLDLLGDRTQNNKYRPTVRLPSFIRAIFHQENLCSQSDMVPNLNNLRNREWRRARDKSGLDDLVVPYSIRHTVARWLRKQGVDAWHTSAQMGHKTKGAEITEVYASFDPRYLEDALQAIEDFYAEILKYSAKLGELIP